jgi:hypothetical protein
MLGVTAMLRRTLLFCTALLFGFASALAQDVPPVDPPDQWRTVGQNDATSSSRCIGQPTTPLCAVETLLACFQRGQLDLCRMVDDGAEQYAQVFATPVDPGKRLTYRVVAVDRPEAQPGDMLIILEQREISADRPGPAAGPSPSDFLLRQQPDGRWKIVRWGEPGD